MDIEQIKKSRKILKNVADIIESEPKKYDQDNWCGTSCCIAGHIVFSQGAKRIKSQDFFVKFNNKERRVLSLAYKLLGIKNNVKIDKLFGPYPELYWEDKWALQYSKAKNRKEKAAVAADYIRKHIIPTVFPLKAKVVK